MTQRNPHRSQPVVIHETQTRIALKCDGRTVAYVALGPQDSEWALNLTLAINSHHELMDALRKIAAGEGFYGLQAREYKDIAKAAIASVQLSRNSLLKEAHS